MEQKIIDFRSDFRCWLVDQGLSEKTKKGRPGTVYEYLTRLDRLSQRIFNKIDWYSLAEEICGYVLIHVIYRTQKNRRFPVDQVVEEFCMYFHVVYGEVPVNTKTRLKKYARWARQNIQEFQKVKVPLLNFYEYIKSFSKTEEARRLEEMSAKELSRRSARILTKLKSCVKLDYSKADALIDIIKKNGFTGGFFTNVTPVTASEPTKISNQEPNDLLSDNEIKNILGVSDITLWRLKEGKLRGFKLKNCSVENLNSYLATHHHPSNRPSSIEQDEEFERWLTARETAKRLKCSMSYVKKLRQEKQIAYTQNSPRCFRYDPKDVRCLEKTLKK